MRDFGSEARTRTKRDPAWRNDGLMLSESFAQQKSKRGEGTQERKGTVRELFYWPRMSRAKWRRLRNMRCARPFIRELCRAALLWGFAWAAPSLAAAETGGAARADAPPPLQVPKARDAFHLYLVLGTGGVGGPASAGMAPTEAALPSFLYRPEGQWQPLATGIKPEDMALTQFAQGLAQGRKDSGANEAVGLILCAKRGSTLADWAKGGERYTEALREARAALRQSMLAGILWVQGPAPSDTATLGDRLTALADDLRAELGVSHAPFIASRPADARGGRGATALLEQLASLPHRIPYAAVVDVRGLAHGDEGAEFDAAGQRELGKRFAVAASRQTGVAAPAPVGEFRYRESRGVTIQQNVVIGQGGGRDLHVDIAFPTAPPAQPMPAVLMIHGGGWSGGTHKGFLPAELVAQGYFVATVEYRLSGEAPWPAQIQDCKLAVRWLRTNAAKYHVNPDRIGCLGFSAGGHLAACLGALPDTPELAGQGGFTGVSSRVQAVVDESGPTDFTPEGRPLLGETKRDPSALVTLLGGSFADKPDIWRQASPALNVTASTPPFLIFSGEKDTGVPVNQALRMEEALKKAGVPVQLIRVKNGGHGLHADHPGDPAPDPDPKAQWAAIVAFLHGTLQR